MRHLLPAGRLLVCLAFACPAVAAPPALNCRDGKDALPRLQIVQNLWGLRAYPSAESEWPDERKAREIQASGFATLEQEIVRLGRESGELRGDLSENLLLALFEFAFIEIELKDP